MTLFLCFSRRRNWRLLSSNNRCPILYHVGCFVPRERAEINRWGIIHHKQSLQTSLIIQTNGVRKSNIWFSVYEEEKKNLYWFIPLRVAPSDAKSCYQWEPWAFLSLHHLHFSCCYVMMYTTWAVAKRKSDKDSYIWFYQLRWLGNLVTVN